MCTPHIITLFPYTTLFRSRLMLDNKEMLSMSGNRGCIFNSIMFLVIVFVPVVGHIIETIMVFEDDHSLAGTARSEEHTSELQSLRHLVCRLLLEKKKLAVS